MITSSPVSEPPLGLATVNHTVPFRPLVQSRVTAKKFGPRILFFLDLSDFLRVFTRWKKSRAWTSGRNGTVYGIYSRQQNPHNVLYFWKDRSIAHEGNILNPWKYYGRHFNIIPKWKHSHKFPHPYLVGHPLGVHIWHTSDSQPSITVHWTAVYGRVMVYS